MVVHRYLIPSYSDDKTTQAHWVNDLIFPGTFLFHCYCRACYVLTTRNCLSVDVGLDRTSMLCQKCRWDSVQCGSLRAALQACDKEAARAPSRCSCWFAACSGVVWVSRFAGGGDGKIQLWKLKLAATKRRRWRGEHICFACWKIATGVNGSNLTMWSI